MIMTREKGRSNAAFSVAVLVLIRFADIVIKTKNLCSEKILNTCNGAEDFS